MSKDLGETAQKTLLLLKAGLLLGLSGSPRNYFRILRATGKEWQDIEKKSLHRTIKNLYKSKLVDITEDKNSMVVLRLSDKGRERVLKYAPDSLAIPQMKRWDSKWRMVLFDIPEFRRRSRDAIRLHLKRLGFFEYQKSVFVHPFKCENEIEFLVEFHNLRPYVRFVVAHFLDNELHLKKHFELI